MSEPHPFDEGKPVQCVRVGDQELRPGSRVRLWPLGRADIFDLALEGKTAIIDSIERDFEGRTYLAVLVEDDPGRDLGAQKQPGHRFFFGIEEVELLADGDTP